ncbi:TniQ family protein [Paenibacillus sp. WC2504]|uniref:TniQ family protein n=1 Tax=Paenibacillus sp. WC2504 TaxID=3461403 RepID=UPI004045DB4B
MKPFKNQITMYEDESVEGFVFRLAHINYIPTNFMRIEKLKRKFDKEQISIYFKAIETLSEAKIVEENLLHEWSKDYFTLPDWNRGQYSRFCPECLLNRAYHRMNWGLSFTTHCKIHQVYLLENCICCNKRINIQEIVSDQCFVCKKELTNFIASSILEVQNYLNLDEYYATSFYSIFLTYKEYLKFFRRVVYILGTRYLKLSIWEKEKYYFRNNGYLEDITQLCELNKIVYSIFEAWPSEAVNFLIKNCDIGIGYYWLENELFYIISKLKNENLRKMLRNSIHRDYGWINSDKSILERLIGHEEREFDRMYVRVSDLKFVMPKHKFYELELNLNEFEVKQHSWTKRLYLLKSSFKNKYLLSL